MFERHRALLAEVEEVARLGHSGNSTEPHLHVHVTDGRDIAYSRSLPFAIDDAKVFPSDGTIRHLHSGHVVENVAAEPQLVSRGGEGD